MRSIRRIALCLAALAWPCAADVAPPVRDREDEPRVQQALAGDWQPADVGSASATAPLAWRVDTGGVAIVNAHSARAPSPLTLRAFDPRNGHELAMLNAPLLRQKDRLLFRSQTVDGGLSFEVVIDAQADRIDLCGFVTNRGGGDRPLQVRIELAMDAVGWRWWDSLRASRVIDPRQRYATTTPVPVGLRGAMSTYPFSCLASEQEALSFAVPLRRPRVFEIAYEGPRRTYGIGFDVALAPDPVHLPNQATFFCALYAPDPAGGFRAAAQSYYDLYPEDFARRTERDGSWMPFTRIDTVRDADDFRFAFHEYGSVDLPDNNRRGIYSFRYLEPWTYWMKMEADRPRDLGTARTQLLAHAEGPDTWDRGMARATLASAMKDVHGRFLHQFVNEPWCSGTLFFNNSDPDLPVPQPGYTNMGELNLGLARGEILGARAPQAPGWEAFGDGYTIADGVAHDPRGRTLRLEKSSDAAIAGAVQTVVLDQAEPRPLVLRASSRAEQVTGAADHDYALYADVHYADGTYLWSQATAFDTGIHDWQERRLVIVPGKPVKLVKLLALLRGNHRGTAWFDGLSLTEADPGAPDAGPERVRNGGFEEVVDPGRVDGIYLDSMEGWAKRLNFRREHFRWVDVPLTYETGTGRPAILNAFSIFEFTRAMSDFLHDHDRLLMANWVLIDFPFYAALLDVPGKEVHWLDHAGRFAPDSDDVMSYRRVLSRHKPYPLLLNVRFDRFTPKMMDWFFQRCLLYAMAPGMFSHDAATDPYFENPAMYDRDRPLFMRYMPVLQRLSRAGWEPLTGARADAPLLVERYGTHSVSGLFLAVHNDGEAPARGRILLDRTALGLEPGASAVELLSGRRVALAEEAAIDARLDGYQTHVYRLLNPGEAATSTWALESLAAAEERARVYGRQQRLPPDAVTRIEAVAAALREALDTSRDPDALDRAVARLAEERDRAAALPQPDLGWRLDEAQNAWSGLQAARAGLELDVTGALDLVSPSTQTCAVTVTHHGTRAFEVAGLTIDTPAGRRHASAPASARALSAGRPRTLQVTLEVPPHQPAGTPWPVTVDLQVEAAGATPAAPLRLVRRVMGRIVPAAEAQLTPARASSFGGPARLQLDLQNNGPDPLSLQVLAASGWTLSWTGAQHTLAADGRGTLALLVQPPAAVAPTGQEVVVTLLSDGLPFLAVTSRVTAYPASRNLLARDGVTVQVDSTFSGYGTEALHDGIVDTRGLSWSDAAWASAEVASPHWVEALLPAPVTAGVAVLHWAEDRGVVQRSRQVRIEIARDGAWSPLAVTPETAADGRATRLIFQPQVVECLRLWQDVGDGPAGRPDLLWLDEWELLPPASR